MITRNIKKMFLLFKVNITICVIAMIAQHPKCSLLFYGLGRCYKKYATLKKRSSIWCFSLPQSLRRWRECCEMPLKLRKSVSRPHSFPLSVRKPCVRQQEEETGNRNFRKFCFCWSSKFKPFISWAAALKKRAGGAGLFISIIKEISSHWNRMPFSVTDSC